MRAACSSPLGYATDPGMLHEMGEEKPKNVTFVEGWHASCYSLATVTQPEACGL